METIIIGVTIGLLIGIFLFFMFPYIIPEVRTWKNELLAEIDRLETALARAEAKVKELEHRLVDKV